MAEPKIPKMPKWRAEWDKLVGAHKYLMIKNWDSYQELTPSGIPAHWIKDYVNQDFDEPLSLVECAMRDKLRRFRGRLGSNIPANVELMLSGCGVMGKDRHYVPETLLKLIRSGRLVPTNQLDSVSKKRIVNNRIEKNSTLSGDLIDLTNATLEDSILPGAQKQQEQNPPQSATVESTNGPLLPVHPAPQAQSTESPAAPPPAPPASAVEVSLAKRLYLLLDKPEQHAVNSWPAHVAPLLAHHAAEEIQQVMEFSVRDNDYSAEYLTVAKQPMATFVKNYDTLFLRWKALQKGKAAAASKAAQLGVNKAAANQPAYKQDAAAFDWRQHGKG